MPLATRAFHVVSSEVAPLSLLIVFDNNMCHHQTTINSLSRSNWVEYYAFAMRNNQPTSPFVSRPEIMAETDLTETQVPISSALEKTTIFQTDITSFLQLRRFPRYHGVYSAFQVTWTSPTKQRLFSGGLQPLFYFPCYLGKKEKRSPRLYKNIAKTSLWSCITLWCIYASAFLSVIAINKAPEPFGLLYSSTWIKWLAYPCLGKVRFSLCSRYGLIHVWAKSAFLCLCSRYGLIHVWAKSAFLCLCSRYGLIHVWAKSAFLFSDMIGGHIHVS